MEWSESGEPSQRDQWSQAETSLVSDDVTDLKFNNNNKEINTEHIKYVHGVHVD